MPKGGAKQKKAQVPDEEDYESLAAALGVKAEPESPPLSFIPPDLLATLPKHPGAIVEREVMPLLSPASRSNEAAMAELMTARPFYREAGHCHQLITGWAQEHIVVPGRNLYEMSAFIEEGCRRIVGFDPPRRGLAFPCGVSVDDCAAHFTPLKPSPQCLGPADVIKVDFGIAIEGYIADSSFTACYDSRFDPLIEASRAGTNEGIKYAGPDAYLPDLAARIEEAISGYQLELDGQIIPIRPIGNLGGHGVGQYQVHCGNSIFAVKKQALQARMRMGEVYACETFATTGRGMIVDRGETSHFMLVDTKRACPRTATGLRDLLYSNFKTLAFCQRFIEYANGGRDYSSAFTQLLAAKAIRPYPPLFDLPVDATIPVFISQHEHTFGIFEDHKEVFTRGC